MSDPIRRLRELMAEARLGALVYEDTGTQVWEATGKGPALAFDVRGWGWIQKEPNAEAMQDARGKLVSELLNLAPQLVEVCEAAREVLAPVTPDDEQRPNILGERLGKLSKALAGLGGEARND